ncbi:ferritin-like domain-containing protein [Vallitalea maricola]|uniref:Ferritin family protein n=1 Tax=Vallitalea maricola TaxID=3074433 RepID=A0ACB5UPQ0_9FIRM|nr:ferritin family protein [Vallitalea sp. AN17-2]
MKKIRCLICGMIINDKNYNMNDSTFIDKNEVDDIVRCPFCGVTKEYLSDDEEYINFNSDDLEDKTRKVLDMGMKLEMFNGDFYEEASKQAKDEKLKKMFKDLSNIEMMHARVHKNFGGFNTFPSLKKIDYKKHNTDELLLIEANKREKHAIEFYERYFSKVPDSIKKIFKALSDVEKEHITIIRQID